MKIEGLSGIKYEANDAIRIIGDKQIAAYWLNGVRPLDIFPSRDKEGRPILVAVFKRSETKEVFDLWVKRELK